MSKDRAGPAGRTTRGVTIREVTAASHPRGLPTAARRRLATVAAFAVAGMIVASALPLTATAAEAGFPAPSSAFLQVGVANETQMLIAGATWDWDWHRHYRFGRFGGYLEATFGRWNSDSPQGGSAWVTQLGVTPVLRLHPQSWGGSWFLEAGIGANVLLPVYRSRTTRFSTVFNFGDHLAVGRQFGRNGRHELALRVQHFSNAGIRKPNPGEDFVQIRYSRRF